MLINGRRYEPEGVRAALSLMTYAEFGSVFGVTRQRAHQIRQRLGLPRRLRSYRDNYVSDRIKCEQRLPITDESVRPEAI